MWGWVCFNTIANETQGQKSVQELGPRQLRSKLSKKIIHNLLGLTIQKTQQQGLGANDRPVPKRRRRASCPKPFCSHHTQCRVPVSSYPPTLVSQSLKAPVGKNHVGTTAAPPQTAHLQSVPLTPRAVPGLTQCQVDVDTHQVLLAKLKWRTQSLKAFSTCKTNHLFRKMHQLIIDLPTLRI